MKNIIVLPKGALVTTNEANRPMVSALKGIGCQYGCTAARDLISFVGWDNCRAASYGEPRTASP